MAAYKFSLGNRARRQSPSLLRQFRAQFSRRLHLYCICCDAFWCFSDAHFLFRLALSAQCHRCCRALCQPRSHCNQIDSTVVPGWPCHVAFTCQTTQLHTQQQHRKKRISHPNPYISRVDPVTRSMLIVIRALHWCIGAVALHNAVAVIQPLMLTFHFAIT